ncbi:MAG TPA: transglutaminase-like domain-containing protein [Solirubrobacteraceae bacterium]|nr:transglutaminase-like domain-containing protein [Solirubrobacteraceae bacterium]
MPRFDDLAADRAARLDTLALALAAEFRTVDEAAALARLDELAVEVAAAAAGSNELDALIEVLGRQHGFAGARDEYDHPDNSMLDLVLERGRGLPIALSVVYVETARRAGIALDGVGLPGHYVVGQFPGGGAAPTLLDPFAGGVRLDASSAVTAASGSIRAWGAHETALRMLNNLVGSYTRRNDLGRAIRAAELRLELPLERDRAGTLAAELRGLRARLN